MKFNQDRIKAKRDRRSQMIYAEREGEKRGLERGLEQGRQASLST
jgi:hypothetical protein